MTELFLYDPIAADTEDGGGWGGIIPADFIKQLFALERERHIVLRFNSPGGSVFEGWAIYNAIVNMRALGHHFTAKDDGLCASIATVIALGCDHVAMGQASLLMVHKPMATAIGDDNSMRKMISVLEKIQSQLIDVYQKKSGQPRKTIEAWVAAETWFTAEEALAARLIDEISSESSPRNRIDISQWAPPATALAKSRKRVEAVRSEMILASAKVKTAKNYAEAVEFAHIAATAAKRLLDVPGATDRDADVAVSVATRLNVFANSSEWNDYPSWNQNQNWY